MDIRTLLISNSAYLLLYFFALLLITAFTPKAGMKWFAASYGFLAFGDLLVAGRGHISPFLSIIAGNSFILFGFALLHKGSLDFMGEGRKHLFWVLGSLPVAALCLAYYTYEVPSTVARIIVITLTLAVITALTASVLFPNSKGVPSRRAIALIVASYSVLNLGRAVLTAWLGAPQDFLRNDTFQAVSMLGSGLLVCALLLGFTWMMNARLQMDLEHAANIDSLTGVMNRRAIEEVLRKEIPRCGRADEKLSVLLLDVDNFKRINDNWGHEAGDEVLKRVAEGIVSELRATDQVARWGGEEFCCVLPCTCLEEGVEVAEGLREGLASILFDLGGSNTLRLTVSIGVSEALPTDTTFTLVRRADDALYRAKRSGRDRVCMEEALSLDQIDAAIDLV